MNSVVYTRIPACDQALVKQAASCGVADLHEALGAIDGRMALMSPQMRGINRGVRIAGQAITAYNFAGDNLLMHRALRLATAGQVVVTSNGGISQGAQWGEMATLNARRKGLAGVIVDGNIRDADAIAAMGFPIWSTWISPSHSEKRGPGFQLSVPACLWSRGMSSWQMATVFWQFHCGTSPAQSRELSSMVPAKRTGVQN